MSRLTIFRVLSLWTVLTVPLFSVFASANASTAAVTSAPSSESFKPQQSDYRLGGGDSIRISVYQNPDLALDARVGESGDITFPLVGKLNVGGMTIDEASKAISDELMRRELVKHAQVSIVLLQVRGNQVSVLGQVNRPGRIPLETSDMRLSDVLASAGGVINAANAATVSAAGADHAVVVGTRDGKPFRAEVDLASLFLGDHPGDDIVMKGGDTVYVPPAPIYYIYGEVQRPGTYVVTRGMTVQQALAQAGGPTLRGTERGLHIDRRESDGVVKPSTPAMNDAIQSNDVLYVPESLF
jgi:polysaccharide biosynthesis/export protein